MDIVVTIIGFGNIGKTIGALLLPYKACSLTINIIDTDWNVVGAILDLEHALQLHPQHRIVRNSEELLNASDVIFHCAGAAVPKGKSRLVTCQASIEITEAIFSNFKPANTPFIIVVANPVEIISFVTQRLTGLPAAHVIGTGTLLDSVRMNHRIRQTHTNVQSVNAVLLGEHGTTTFISEQLSTVNGRPLSATFDRDTLDELLILVKASAEEIKTTQECTIYGVSFCALQIFEALTLRPGQQLPVSTSIPAHLQQTLGASDVFVSLMCAINRTGAHALADYEPTAEEVAGFKKSIALIRQSIPASYL